MPKPVERKPFLESIHKAQYAKLPDNFKKLDEQAITEVLKNPLTISMFRSRKRASNLPTQFHMSYMQHL